MTQFWKGFLAAVVSVATITAIGARDAAARGQENSEPAESAEAKDGDENDAIEFDSSESDSADEDATMEKVADDELGDPEKSNSPEELLNLATEIKLTANTLIDLTKVVSLCNKAEKLGLDADNLEYARQLRLSAQLDRGLAIAQLFMDPELDLSQLPRGWEGLRDSAIGDLNAAAQENPDVAAAQLGLGRLYMISEKPDEAKAAFDAAINGVDESGEVEVKTLAYWFRSALESDAQAAIPYLEKAIEICPSEEPRLYSALAERLAQRGLKDDSLKAIEKGLELAPDNGAFKKQKARVLAMLNRKDEARALYEEASQGEDGNLVAQIEKGEFYAVLGDRDSAVSIFTNLIKKFDGPGLYFLRGAVYCDMKEYQKALADANQALRRDGNLIPALRLKGAVYLQMERFDDAARIFEQMKRKAKTPEEKLEATTQIAFAVAKQGYYTRAADSLRKALEENPKNVGCLRTLADIELLYGHWGEAKKYYVAILDVDPENTGALNNYSWLLGTCPDDQTRDGSLALEYGKKAAEASHYEEAYILSTLAAAYAETGDFEAAREWSQKSVEVATENNDDCLESVKKELESYKENKPWRETSEIMKEIDENAEQPADEKKDEGEKPEEEKPGEENSSEEKQGEDGAAEQAATTFRVQKSARV